MSLPKISIVTPIYQVAPFIRDALESVHNQHYPNLEHIIIDGGSTDGTVDILREYEDRLAYWVSEPDKGQYDAINKGFSHATGDIYGWLNGDDIYLPWTLKTVGRIFAELPEVEWISTMYPITMNEDKDGVLMGYRAGFNRKSFWMGDYTGLRWGSGWIMQESTFWRRSLWEQAGGYVSTEYSLASDFELWARFYKQADLYGLHLALAGFRVRTGQRSASYDKYKEEAREILIRHGGKPRTELHGWLRRFKYRIPRRILKFLHQTNEDHYIQYSQATQQWKAGVYR